jgi:hypothetical protein
MQLLKDAGIYVLVAFHNPDSTRIDVGPYTSTTFSAATLRFHISIVDSLQQYQNVLGFIISTSTSDFVLARHLPTFRAYARDIKAHIKSTNSRSIPVGAEVVDNGGLPVLDYMTCGSPESAIDFYIVSRLDEEGAMVETHNQRAKAYRNASVPLIANYGHAANRSTSFEEIPYLYQAPITDVFSGVYINEWFPQGSRISADMGTSGRYISNK